MDDSLDRLKGLGFAPQALSLFAERGCRSRRAIAAHPRGRPFHLLVILQEINLVPFADKPTKSAYTWLAIERRAAAVDQLKNVFSISRERAPPANFAFAGLRE
jgi:hypothetical protein